MNLSNVRVNHGWQSHDGDTKLNFGPVFKHEEDLLTWQTENLEGKKVVRSYMTKEPVIIDEDTPWCCNPASETYWSM